MTDVSKSMIRQTQRRFRQQLLPEESVDFSQRICQHIVTTEIYQQAVHVALYQPIHHEVDVHFLWHDPSFTAKQAFFPVIHHDKTLIFLPANPTTPFKPNHLGILEPDVALTQAIDIQSLDLMIIPVLAFDLHGTRIGMGGGYYDRTLAHQRPGCLMGVAYQGQHQALIPQQPWDIPLSMVVTETTIYRCTPS